jgi:hypothetical protein
MIPMLALYAFPELRNLSLKPQKWSEMFLLVLGATKLIAIGFKQWLLTQGKHRELTLVSLEPLLIRILNISLKIICIICEKNGKATHQGSS